jgi:hypothetical protein
VLFGRARVETFTFGNLGELAMWTTLLAYVIAFTGFITFAGGAMGILILMFEDMAQMGRVPLRHYATMVALVSSGLGLIGIAQGLRLLLLIVGKD